MLLGIKKLFAINRLELVSENMTDRGKAILAWIRAT